jgi:hypothetical protein
MMLLVAEPMASDVASLAWMMMSTTLDIDTPALPAGAA